eukprot:CAMPEP_0206464990 /NCGR_PEP_ID=MMETSP0324_2-20121206/27551_1 /ASSEMBLY_ACC=CAM_ASM_000836 /TAXON_ID=2866 /ORGANISM="Crypthecodinium cohnii, Strain Seligo" /LENGTH=296 /DNA_ID=CAMNT_0053937739 /DNA_START=50 /DNA_END=940 /DNA_ORIENTATION=+
MASNAVAAATRERLSAILRSSLVVATSSRPRPGSLWSSAGSPTTSSSAALLSAALPLRAPLLQQRRWWFDPDATKRNHDKPAVTGSSYVFIKAHVPVVLLDNVKGLGKSGQIVHVKRGYARHFLVPKGLAVFGTWENIDAYADPELMEDPAMKARVASQTGRLPFDWVDEIELRFVRWTREDDSAVLVDPISIWDVLEALSTDHELDLLPTNISMPEQGFTRSGHHEVPVRIAFRNPETASGRYTVKINAVSQQSLQDEMAKEEMAKAVADRSRFKIQQRGGAMDFETDSEEEEDE